MSAEGAMESGVALSTLAADMTRNFIRLSVNILAQFSTTM
jgi:hypothetical protein